MAQSDLEAAVLRHLSRVRPIDPLPQFYATPTITSASSTQQQQQQQRPSEALLHSLLPLFPTLGEASRRMGLGHVHHTQRYSPTWAPAARVAPALLTHTTAATPRERLKCARLLAQRCLRLPPWFVSVQLFTAAVQCRAADPTLKDNFLSSDSKYTPTALVSHEEHVSAARRSLGGCATVVLSCHGGWC